MTDVVLMRITDYFLVIPDIPLMIIDRGRCSAAASRNIIIIIGIIYWTSTARLIRAQVKSVRERVYVKRARSLGASNNRLMFKHVLPQVAPLLIANTVLMVALAIFAETYITFLGLGDPSAISWGRLIENAFLGNAVLNNAWWAIVPPGVCVTLVILACTMVGQSMEDALNPRLKVGHLSVRRFRLRPLQRQAGRGVSREPCLSVEDLHVWFDLAGGGELHAVQGVSFDLRPGERMGLVGESGCGKTTTILAMMGLLPSSASVGGRVCAGRREHPGRGRGLRQPAPLEGHRDGLPGGDERVQPGQAHRRADRRADGAARHGHRQGAAQAQARELLELVGISGARADRYPHEFSGGMRQRAAIALALACQPKVLLADEPTTALDVMVQAQILELLVRLTRDLGLAMILVTHDLPVVAQVCDRAAVMYAGEIVEMGATATSTTTPRHPYTRMLFAATPDLLGRRRRRLDPRRPAAARPRDRRAARSRPAATPRSRPARPWRPRSAARSAPGHEARVPSQRPGGRRGAPHERRGRAGAAAGGRRSGHALPDRRGLVGALRAPPQAARCTRSRASRSRSAAGEMVALVGESGCGKTTHRPDRDPDGRERRRLDPLPRQASITGLSERRDASAAARDPDHLPGSVRVARPALPVRDTIEEPLLIHGVGGSPRGGARGDRCEALERAGLTPPELFIDRFPHELSGGQRQRVAIAAALVLEPEAAGGRRARLDARRLGAGRHPVAAGRAAQGAAWGILMITHDLSTAAHFADRIAVMYLGRIVEEGPAQEVVRNPQHPYTKALHLGRPEARPAGAD